MNTNGSQSNPDLSAPSASAATARKLPLWRIILASALALAMILMIVVMVVQTREWSFYRAPPAVWPEAALSEGAVAMPEPVPVTSTAAPILDSAAQTITEQVPLAAPPADEKSAGPSALDQSAASDQTEALAPATESSQ